MRGQKGTNLEVVLGVIDLDESIKVILDLKKEKKKEFKKTGTNQKQINN